MKDADFRRHRVMKRRRLEAASRRPELNREPIAGDAVERARGHRRRLRAHYCCCYCCCAGDVSGDDGDDEADDCDERAPKWD